VIGEDNRAYCWGDNYFSQLGVGEDGDQRQNSSTPLPVKGPGPAGADYFLVKDIISDGEHNCALSMEDTTNGIEEDMVYCWGFNSFGQLGNGSSGSNSSIPVPVVSSADGKFTGKAKALDVSWLTSCAVSAAAESEGQLYCWGNGGYGQLGKGDNEGSLVPIAVSPSADGKFTGQAKSIAVGSRNACATNAEDILYCWGSNNVGQLGIGYETPISIPVDPSLLQLVPIAAGTGGNDLAPFKTLAVVLSGGEHMCALHKEKLDSMWCWGFNRYGQLGQGNEDNSTVPLMINWWKTP
jgi:alpha-tubulin suppressor-like RCC1 family protein